MFALSKAADIDKLVQGGQLYRGFSFSKGSLSTLTCVLPYKFSIVASVLGIVSSQISNHRDQN